MSKFSEKVVCDDGAGSGVYRDILSVLESVTDTKCPAGTVDICLTAADEIRRLRRKCNRLRTRANASEKAASAAMLIARTTIKVSLEHERDQRRECEERDA